MRVQVADRNRFKFCKKIIKKGVILIENLNVKYFYRLPELSHIQIGKVILLCTFNRPYLNYKAMCLNLESLDRGILQMKF